MSDRWMQSLVNAQVEINRAVFLMNVQMNKKEYQGFLTPEEYSDAAIKKRIKSCIDDLTKALKTR